LFPTAGFFAVSLLSLAQLKDLRFSSYPISLPIFSFLPLAVNPVGVTTNWCYFLRIIIYNFVTIYGIATNQDVPLSGLSVNQISRQSDNAFVRAQTELSAEEMSDTEYWVNEEMQRKAFKEEYQSLVNHKQLPTSSKLLGKLDSEGVLRSDGRLTYAEFLPHDVRYPIILPHKNWVTKLIVKYHHKLGNHSAGTNQTFSSLSTRFWIISAREEILEWERQCASCKRRKANRLWYHYHQTDLLLHCKHSPRQQLILGDWSPTWGIFGIDGCTSAYQV